MCLEDGADLSGGLTGSADDGKLLLLQSEAEEEDDEYMDHLVSKESSFCCSLSSSASSSPAFSDFSDAGAESSPSPMPSFEDWSRCTAQMGRRTGPQGGKGKKRCGTHTVGVGSANRGLPN